MTESPTQADSLCARCWLQVGVNSKLAGRGTTRTTSASLDTSAHLVALAVAQRINIIHFLAGKDDSDCATTIDHGRPIVGARKRRRPSQRGQPGLGRRSTLTGCRPEAHGLAIMLIHSLDQQMEPEAAPGKVSGNMQTIVSTRPN